MCPNILVVNPNTTRSLTERMRRELQKIATSGTNIVAVNPEQGPSVIDTSRDEVLCVPGLIEVVEQNQKDCDGIIIACFSDPGIEAVREAVRVPVFGIGEASYYAAYTLGNRFSVLVTDSSRVIPKRQYMRMLGVESKLASIRSLDLPRSEAEGLFCALDADLKAAINKAVTVGRKAEEEDKADVVILGCAGYVGTAPTIASELKIRVIDPTTMAFVMMEGLLRLR